MGPSATYQIPPYTELVLRQLGEESVVYNCASGATHVLDPAGAALLKMLCSGAQTRQALLTGLTKQGPVAEELELGEFVDQALAQFTELGLVEEAGGQSIDS